MWTLIFDILEFDGYNLPSWITRLGPVDKVMSMSIWVRITLTLSVLTLGPACSETEVTSEKRSRGKPYIDGESTVSSPRSADIPIERPDPNSITLRAVLGDAVEPRLYNLNLKSVTKDGDVSRLVFGNDQNDVALITRAKHFTSAHLMSSNGVFEFSGPDFQNEVFPVRGFRGDDFVVDAFREDHSLLRREVEEQTFETD
jgi:hypothetical protein